jgi:hypothetical protein
MTELIDGALEMHERYLGKQFRKAERRHLSKFQENGKAINERLKRYAALGRALIDAKTLNGDLLAAVEGVLPWNELAASVAEAEKLAQPGVMLLDAEIGFMIEQPIKGGVPHRGADEFADELALP